MALLDQLHKMEQQVERRLRELQPLVSEYHELQKVAQRLGVRHADGKAAAAPTRPASRARRVADTKSSTASRSRRTTRRRARRRNAAAPGSREHDVLRLVNERPGISVPELGKELGVDPTGLYQIVRRLQGRGVIRKEGRQLQPVAGASAAAADGEGTAPAS